MPLQPPGDPGPPGHGVTGPHQMTVEMDTERTRARHRDKTQDVFAEESEALDQIAKQVIINNNLDTASVKTKSE